MDPTEALAAGRDAARIGRASEALAWFEKAWRARRVEAAAIHYAELAASVAEPERATHVPLLVEMERAGARSAELWKSWFPAVARVAGAPVVLDFVLRHARDATPVRLGGTCDASQELVARALAELGGRRRFSVQREGDVCPSLELERVRSRFGEARFDALFLFGQSHSHFSRLVERLVAFCASNGIRALLGIRRDAWDGERFEPFELGPELEVAALEERVPDADAARWLERLLAELGVASGPLPEPVLRALATVAWTPRRLFLVARRCAAHAAGDELVLVPCLLETIAWHARHPTRPSSW